MTRKITCSETNDTISEQKLYVIIHVMTSTRERERERETERERQRILMCIVPRLASLPTGTSTSIAPTCRTKPDGSTALWWPPWMKASET